MTSSNAFAVSRKVIGILLLAHWLDEVRTSWHSALWIHHSLHHPAWFRRRGRARRSLPDVRRRALSGPRGLEKNTSSDITKVDLFASKGDGFHIDTVNLQTAHQRASFARLAPVEMGVKEDVRRSPEKGRVGRGAQGGARFQKRGCERQRIWVAIGTREPSVVSATVWLSGYLDELIAANAPSPLRFGTYDRDGFIGLDYADQRFYASAYGRFATVDRSHSNVSLGSSQTWNAYAYVNGDPISSNDPLGLCAVLIGGITMGPEAGSPFDLKGVELGANVAYPYSGQNGSDSVGSVFSQAAGPNEATNAALGAIRHSLSTNSGLIDIIAYSGGASAFTGAFGLLSASERARIGIIQYISPGIVGELASVQGTTKVLTGTGTADVLATFLTTVPLGVPHTVSDCAHTDLACLFAAAQSTLATIKSNGACEDTDIFTRARPGGSVVPASPAATLTYSRFADPFLSLRLLLRDPEPFVTGTITYDQ